MLLLHNTPEHASALKNAYRQFPAKDSTLDLDFINNRQSIAGVANSESGRINLLTYSEQFDDNAAWTKTRCTISPNATEAPDGTMTADLQIEDTQNGGHHINRTYAFQAGTTYTLSMYVKQKDYSQGSIRLGNAQNIFNGGYAYATYDLATKTITKNANALSAKITEIKNGWYRVAITAVAGVTASDSFLHFLNTLSYPGDGVRGTYIWGAQLERGSVASTYIPTTTAPLYSGGAMDGITFTRSTTATYFGADGTLQTAAINEPRFDYDPVSLRPLGLLIEDSRSNLLTYSNNFTNAAWSSTGLTITPAGTGPDGTTTAYTVTATATNGELYRITTGTSGQPYAFSLWIRRLSGSGIIDLVVGDNIYQTINVTNTLTRVTIFNTPTTTTLRSYLRIRTAGDSISIANAQLEAGAFSTSYIPTTASSATRGADVVLLTGANFSSWYNPAEGTLILVQRTNNPSSAAYSAVIRDAAGVLQGGIGLYYSSNSTIAAARVRDFNAGHGSAITTRSVVLGDRCIAAMAYTAANTTASAAIDGSGTVIGTGAPPPASDTLFIGSNPSSLNALNGYIERIIYVPKRLPNNLLQYLSRATA